MMMMMIVVVVVVVVIRGVCGVVHVRKGAEKARQIGTCMADTYMKTLTVVHVTVFVLYIFWR